MRIVQATPEHLDLLTPLFVKYREFYDAMPYPETSRSFLEKRLTRKESVIYLALADDEDKLMGFCQLYPSFSSLSLKRVWILNDIFVAEDARRQLVADRLIQQAKKLAKEQAKAGPDAVQGPVDQVLSFTLDEIRDARLVPEVSFKGRSRRAATPATGEVAVDEAQELGGQKK